MRRGLLWICAAVVLVAGGVSAKPPTAQDIVKRAADEYDRVQDYAVDARVSVRSPNMRVPETDIKIYYKKPDKLHVESKDGFAALPRQGLMAGNPLREMLKNSELSLAGTERALGRECHLVRATYRAENRTTKARIWIDRERWVVVQMYIDPDSAPSLRLSLWYSKVAGKYWMPSKSQAVIEFAAVDGRPSKESKPAGPSTVTLQFSNYKINTGLSDKIFQKKRSS